MDIPTCAGVYRIVHVDSGHCYIGSSLDIRARHATHMWQLRNGKHHSIHLQRAWDKHGEAAFTFEVLEVVTGDIAELRVREKHYFLTMQPTYNIRPEPDYRGTLAQETREKLRNAHLGKTLTQETRDRMRIAHKGKRQTPEWATKRAQSWVGRKHTDEARAKMGRREPANKGKPMSEEQKTKIAAALRGKPKSAAHRANLSAATIAHARKRKNDQSQ